MSNTSEANYKKMTETAILPLIATLSVPTIINMLITNFYNLVDTAFVGTLGTSASGAVGVVFGFMSILQAIGFLFGQGAGSNMARKLGSRDQDDADTFASFGFFLSFFTAIIIAIVCFIFLDSIISILGSTPTIAPYAKTYITYIIMVAPFWSSSFTLNNLLRYEGKAKLGMIGMMTGSILNIGGDALLMFGFKMGIAGAGLSTAISQVVSFSILLSMYLRGKTECHISIKKLFVPAPEQPVYEEKTSNLKQLVQIKNQSVYTISVQRTLSLLANIFWTGFPSLLRQALASITTMILNQNAAVYGDAAVAAMSIVGRISFSIFSIALGIGQGFQPVSSFNYGAKKFSRVRKSFRVTMILSEITTGVFAVLAGLFTNDLIQIFRNDPEVIEIGRRALQLQCATLLFLPLGMITEMLFQSTGRKFGASVLSSFRGGVVFIPALILFSKFRGLAGIQEAQPFSYVVTGICAFGFMFVYFKNLPKTDE